MLLDHLVTPNEIMEILKARFPNFQYRPHQLEAIMLSLDAIFNKDKKRVVLSLETGTGKSWVAVQISAVYTELIQRYQEQASEDDPKYADESLILTKTILLQNQYIDDFQIHGMKKLISATNFDCYTEEDTGIPRSEKHHANCRYSKTDNMCSYRPAQQAYIHSKLKNLNYAFFFTGFQFFNTDGLLVVDEAHNFEEACIASIAFDLNLIKLARELLEYEEDLDDRLGVPVTSIKALTKHYAFQVSLALRSAMRKINIEIENKTNEIKAETLQASLEGRQIADWAKALNRDIEKTLTPRVNVYSSLAFKLDVLVGSNFDEWVIEWDKDKYQFSLKPVFIPREYYNQLFGRPQAIIFMSATAERVKDSLGLTDEDTFVYNGDYIFPLENRPFFAVTGMPKLNKDTFESAFPDYVKIIDSIISKYPADTNVIIHSVSYVNANKYKELSALKDRIFIPTTEEIRKLKEILKPGTICVSPSITEGVDLGKGLAAVNIFMKCPYPFLGDPWVVKKKDMDAGWYAYATVLAIIQGSGRGVRSSTDKSYTFMLDPTFGWLLGQVKRYVPNWFFNTMKELPVK